LNIPILFHILYKLLSNRNIIFELTPKEVNTQIAELNIDIHYTVDDNIIAAQFSNIALAILNFSLLLPI
jgi:hypothetical protein